ncbi:MAG: 4Fe-4S binding protein [Proteobacteria bacterium]|nr:4Fe-4S binding protein [Pseudomonadota bacterium]
MEKNSKEKKKEVKINREWCKGCGICVAFCPKEVLEMDDDGKALWAHPENCISCGLCELRCPDIAIELQ